MKTLLKLLFLLSLVVRPLLADTTETLPLATEYMSLTGYRVFLDSLRNDMINSLTRRAHWLTAAQIQQLIDACDTDLLEKKAFAVTAERLTQEELRAILEFYRTPIGKQIAAKTGKARVAAYQHWRERREPIDQSITPFLVPLLTEAEQKALDDISATEPFLHLNRLDHDPEVAAAKDKAVREWREAVLPKVIELARSFDNTRPRQQPQDPPQALPSSSAEPEARLP